MLAITAKVGLLKEEVYSAKNVCKDIIGSLSGADDNTNYRRVIGIFAKQAPDWKILIDEKHKMQDIIRKVCTDEISASEAKVLFEKALRELERLDTWLQVPKK